jgi:hypothetical protein
MFSICTVQETLANRRETRKLTTFYKIHNTLCPSYLFNCLLPVTSDVNSYNLRNNLEYAPFATKDVDRFNKNEEQHL